MYNKKTAWENQKAFLESQMNCGFSNIERVARNRYADMIKQEAESKRVADLCKRVLK